MMTNFFRVHCVLSCGTMALRVEGIRQRSLLVYFLCIKGSMWKGTLFLPSACVEADQPQHGQILEYTSLREEKGTSRKIQWELVLSSESQKKKKNNVDLQEVSFWVSFNAFVPQ